MSTLQTPQFPRERVGAQIPRMPYLRRRVDLIWSSSRSSSTGELNWVAKDPIALKYYRLRHDEKFLLDALDGHTSPNELRDMYNSEFSPRKVRTAQVQQLVRRFFDEGLAISSAPNQAQILVGRRRKRSWEACRQAAIAWLFIRFPGIHADPIARYLESKSRFALSRIGAALVCVGGMMSLLVLLANIDKFTTDLVQLNRWVSAHGLLTLSLCVAVCKTLHELGHAVACKHFGGECHEIGPMLMFGIPCLYCDTSDAWLVPEKRKRLTISAAGMIVELIIAMVAIPVWAMTYDGTLHWVSFDLIIVCLGGSILFNANPLLRYDGYYLLSDAIGVENLQSESKQRWQRLVRSLFEGPQPPIAPERSVVMQVFLVFYHMAAWTYRALLMLGLAWIILNGCRAIGQEGLGWQLLAGGSLLFLTTMGIPPAIQAYKKRKNERWRLVTMSQKIRRNAMKVALACVLLTCLFWPFPYSIHSTGELHSKHRTPILSPVSGLLSSWKAYGQQATPGEEVVVLKNSRLLLDRLEADREYETQRLLVNGLKNSQATTPGISLQIPAAEALLDSLKEQRDEALRQNEQLTIKVLQEGLWLEPVATPKYNQDSIHLVSWHVLPLDSPNQGCWIEAGTLLGWVVDTDHWQVSMLVPQEKAGWIARGSQATVMLSHLPQHALQGEVIDISLQPAKELSPRQATWPGVLNEGMNTHPSGGSDLPPAESEPGTPPGIRARQTSYWVTIDIRDALDRVSLQGEVGQIASSVSGLEAKVVVRADPRSIASRVWSWIHTQLQF